MREPQVSEKLVSQVSAGETSLPFVTAVVCTRGRADGIVRTLESILRNDYPHFDLIVVDQSDPGVTEERVRPFLSDGRVRYLRTALRGLSRARNLAIGAATSEIIACTDDDCEVPEDWLQRITAAFQATERVAVVFGNVMPGRHDPEEGSLPSYIRTASFLARSMKDKHKVEGMGACMALRRSAWLSLGGFDPILGAGSAFRSGEDTDFVIRALLTGYHVYETPAFSVIHHGFRPKDQSRRLAEDYMYGTGAAFVKHLKCGKWMALLPLLARISMRWAFRRPQVNYLGNRLLRGLRLQSFLAGMAAGAATPVNVSSGLYAEPAAPAVAKQIAWGGEPPNA